jgi:cell division protease FtsH
VIYGKVNPMKGISTGPGSDIEDHADRLARYMVEKLGMSDEVGIIDAGRDKNHPLGGYKVSEKTRELVDSAVKQIIADALLKAKELLLANQDKLEAMVKILKERETIYQNEIDDIVRPRPKPRQPN